MNKESPRLFTENGGLCFHCCMLLFIENFNTAR